MALNFRDKYATMCTENKKGRYTIMKPIIFVRISSMRYYKGTANDTPENGGSFVTETGEAHECYNFDAVEFDDGSCKCFGFGMITGRTGSIPQIRIENIACCDAFKHEEKVDGVTVVWCAKAYNSQSIRVVGFYKNATVYRYGQLLEFTDGYVQEFNFVANKEDCVLIPYQGRFSTAKWYVPTSGKNSVNFGFGRSSIWYGGSHTDDMDEIRFVEKMIENIDNYDGENWIDKGSEADGI